MILGGLNMALFIKLDRPWMADDVPRGTMAGIGAQRLYHPNCMVERTLEGYRHQRTEPSAGTRQQGPEVVACWPKGNNFWDNSAVMLCVI
jgi:hypothetical protein